MARKVIRTIAISGITLPIVSAPPAGPVSADKTLVAAFGDASKTAVVSNCPEQGEFTVKVLDEGALDPPLPGTVAALTITTTYGDGSATATRALTRSCQVVSATPSVGEVDGERKATIDIVLVPTGGDTPLFTNAATTTTTGS